MRQVHCQTRYVLNSKMPSRLPKCQFSTKKNIIIRFKGNEELHVSDQGERKLEKNSPMGIITQKGLNNTLFIEQ